MAEDKKGGKKEGGGGAKLDVFETLFVWFIALSVLSGIFSHFSLVVNTDAGATVSSGISSFFKSLVVPFLKFFSYALSVLSIFGIVWSIGALTKVTMEQNAPYDSAALITASAPDDKKNKRWERVLGHINSQNLNDWKFAILEADIILDDLLTAMGYRGETIADKLKTVEKSDFLTIDLAWEAHKVRNQIAHEGADFLVTEREARRVIDLFRQVFEEFHFI